MNTVGFFLCVANIFCGFLMLGSEHTWIAAWNFFIAGVCFQKATTDL